MKYVTKPQEVNAIQWKGDNLQQIRKITKSYIGRYDGSLRLTTIYGPKTIKVNDYIVRNSEGVINVFCREEFEDLFEVKEEKYESAINRHRGFQNSKV